MVTPAPHVVRGKYNLRVFTCRGIIIFQAKSACLAAGREELK